MDRTNHLNISEVLPTKVIGALYELGVKYESVGVELVMCGPFAGGFARATSDLDIAIKWHNGRSQGIYIQLLEDIDRLPTIRKVNLVDFDEAGEIRKIFGAILKKVER